MRGVTRLARQLMLDVTGLKMIQKISLIVILYVSMLSATIAYDEGGWVDRNGNPVPNSDDMKSAGGFGGWLVVTPDADSERDQKVCSILPPNLHRV